jgi:hypothetical protein
LKDITTDVPTGPPAPFDVVIILNNMEGGVSLNHLPTETTGKKIVADYVYTMQIKKNNGGWVDIAPGQVNPAKLSDNTVLVTFQSTWSELTNGA